MEEREGNSAQKEQVERDSKIKSPQKGVGGKYLAEYLALRALGFIVTLLPYRAALSVAWLVAAVLFHVCRFRRKETLRRIFAVFGNEITNTKARQIAWISLRNTAFNAVEMFRIRQTTLEELHKRVPNLTETIKSFSAIAAANGKNSGLIIGLPHMGNWDLMGSGCYLEGVPIFSVAAVQRNRLINDYMNQMRSGHGMVIIERGSGTLRQVISRLRQGEAFAILPDTRSRNPDLEIPFLGGRANLARGMASFARAANVPIVPAICLRDGWAHFTLQTYPPLFPDTSLDKHEDCMRMTQHVIGIIDKEIRLHPEQWFWYNKRWVLDPVSK